MFKSLRWRLQVWHAIVLLIVLTIFGAIVHDLHWKSRLQQIDAELEGTSRLAAIQPHIRHYLPRLFRRQRERDENRPENNAPARTDQNSPGQREATAPETARSDDLNRRDLPA